MNGQRTEAAPERDPRRPPRSPGPDGTGAGAGSRDAETGAAPGGAGAGAREDLGGWAARLRAVPVGPDAVRPVPDSAGLPEATDEVREAARLLPDHWLGVVDPMWDDTQDPPAWAIVGQWRSDADGEVVEWADNPDHRPSPAILGWEEPEDALDAAVQLAATGYGPAGEVARVLASAEVSVLVDASGAPVTASAPDGTAVVPVFSSHPHVRKMGALRHRVVTASELVAQIPEGHRLYLNPAGPVGFVVDHGALLEAIREAAA
ncbi:hypothetical protein GCM10018793_35260 [Streptomyces sulfonofaciens]|uniref:SseB protein N-terminal domain-containing protein n=1 Tax=Streptomyces sulfonofaciens TaxID=68272 RepID=A0A919G9H3_9ACTN|nr:type VII secretion system-associated protein [Streptomyces sulfonofaciens]GHH80331.1 hypothetical protein GCM10018793_35260 [Streptomyces sulfonofaciens]